MRPGKDEVREEREMGSRSGDEGRPAPAWVFLMRQGEHRGGPAGSQREYGPQHRYLVCGQARPIPIKGGKEILICLRSRYTQKGSSDHVPKQVKNVPVLPVWKKCFCISLVKKYFPCNVVPWYILSLFLVCLFICLFSIHKVELITLPRFGSPSLMMSLEPREEEAAY